MEVNVIWGGGCGYHISFMGTLAHSQLTVCLQHGCVVSADWRGGQGVGVCLDSIWKFIDGRES